MKQAAAQKNKGAGAYRVLTGLTVLLFLLFLAGLAFGSVNLSLSEIMTGLFGDGGSRSVILRRLRLPRVLGAILSGTALSFAGLLLQTAADNDLCSPNVIGVNGGAGLGVMLILCFLPGAFRLVPLFAFAGALLATLLVIGVSRVSSAHNEKATMLLAGIAVGTMLSAGISFLTQLFPDVASSYVSFSTGGFTGVSFDDLPVPAILIVIGCAAAMLLVRSLRVLCLGDDLARNAGVNVTLTRTLAFVLASLLSAASVSYAGLLGFVGLLVPHMARRLMGNDLKLLFPASGLLGASLVLFADLLGRTLFAPTEISAGVFLNFIGAPFFVYLLIRRRRKHD